jgi:hypothetical protein
MRGATEEKKRPERQRVFVEVNPYNTSSRFLSESDMHLLISCLRPSVRSFQLDVPDNSALFRNQIVPAVINFRLGDLKCAATVRPGVLEQLADEQVFDEPLSIR